MATTEPKLIKVRLTNRGEDSETPWAHDLGPAPGTKGARRVKLVNVPFMHAKPTWGDIIVVYPLDDDFPTWDREGVPWKQVASRIVEDGGRWAMIVDYLPLPGTDLEAAYLALVRACEAERVVCEGAWSPRDADPGRAYLAVPKDIPAEVVMARLRALDLPLRLIQIHPEPKKITRAQTDVGVTAPTPRKPAVAVKATPAAPAKATPAAKARPAAKKPAPVKAKPAAVKAKPAAKKPAVKAKPAAKKPAVKAKPAAKKPAAKKPAAKKPAAKKPAAKKKR